MRSAHKGACCICGALVVLSGRPGLRRILAGRATCSPACKEALRRADLVHATAQAAVANSARMVTANPMHDPASRRRLSATMKRRGIRPIFNGGKGHGLTTPQKTLLAALGPEWVAEHVVTTGLRRKSWARSYSLDIACPAQMLDVEVDGPSHLALKIREADRRRDAVLAMLGWRVLRVTNEEILSSVGEVAARVGIFALGGG